MANLKERLAWGGGRVRCKQREVKKGLQGDL